MTETLKEFSSLHNHTHFSVFDGLSTPEELLKAAKEKGLKSIAVTDHGVTHAHADIYLTGKKLGVRTVFGVEAYVIHSLSEWKELKLKLDQGKKKKSDEEFANDGDPVDSKELKKKGHLVILACNREGLSNLYRLVFDAHKRGFYGKPRMDKEMLKACRSGLVASSACMGGVISKRLWDFKKGDCTWADVVYEAKEYDEIFGRGRFFLELQFNEMDAEQNYINESLVKIHKETGIPLTVTTDSHYARQEDWEPREILHMLGWSKKTVLDMPEKKIDTVIKQLYVKSPEEMWLTYEKYAAHRVDPLIAMQAFQNTILIDSLIEDYEPDTHQRLPTLKYENPFKEMGEKAIDGLRRFGLANKPEYKQQLLHELKVIKDKGISNYFLIMKEMVSKAREEMLVGPGRGSAAGSLVCWCLGITDMDPIQHGLMFERFLDVNRAELPDIDVDFEDPDAAKEILRKMFGENNVASVSTYGTFQLKSLIKDLARVYALDHVKVNMMNRQMDKELKILFKDADKNLLFIKPEDAERVSPTYNKFMEENPLVANQIKTLYGRIRQVGCHASAVLVGDDLPGETSVFVTKDRGTGQGVIQASFTEGIVNKNISAMGFVKFDILGLTNLKVIKHTLKLIAEKTGRPFDELYDEMRAHRLDLNDEKVLKHVFWKGNFCGIFQFTGAGIRRLGMKVRPTTFDDVSAICSLYRPGPLGGGYDKKFVEAKRNANSITYAHPLLEEILKKTNGCLVFQEQLMKACNSLGKMSWKDVSRVRKNLLKKDKSKGEDFFKNENDELGAKFLAGAKENGMEEEAAKQFWADILKFGNYAFNEAHSDSYSAVTMQTAHLATYHPLEFYSSVLTVGAAQELQDIISDIRRAGVKLLPLDVNSSKHTYSIEGDSIRMSLSSIGGVGPATISKITDAAPYVSFQDFLDRSQCGKGVVIPLIQLGAFSSIAGCENMKLLMKAYETWLVNAPVTIINAKGKEKSVKLQSVGGRDKWLQTFDFIMQEVYPDWQPHEKSAMEHELLGFNTSGSPFEILDREKKIEAIYQGKLPTYAEFMEGEELTGIFPVTVKSVRERPQKNKQMMAFVKFGTSTGEEFDAPAFGTTWRWVGPVCKPGGVYVVTFNRREDDLDSLVIGMPGFAQTQHSCAKSWINVDEITI